MHEVLRGWFEIELREMLVRSPTSGYDISPNFIAAVSNIADLRGLRNVAVFANPRGGISVQWRNFEVWVP